MPTKAKLHANKSNRFWPLRLLSYLAMFKFHSVADSMPCDRCLDLVKHSRELFAGKSSLGIRSDGSGLPHLKSNSLLNWYPSFEIVCVFPIEEVDDEDNCEVDAMLFSELNPHRPLFYSELSSRGFQVVMRRRNIIKRLYKRRKIA